MNMSDNLQTSLPHVLTGYNPDYVPPTTPGNKSKSSHKCQASVNKDHLDKKQKGKDASIQSINTPVQNKDSPVEDKDSPVENKDSPLQTKDISKSSAKSRSAKSSRRRSRKSDSERYEELSVKWDQAKAEVRLEDHDQLKEKIILQQELIRTQEQYAEQRRAQIEHAELQKKEAEKSKKQAREAELKQICKQSLEEDRKHVLEEKRAKARAQNSASTTKDVPIKSPTTPTTPGGRRSNPFKMTLPAMSATPDIVDDDDDDETDQQEMTVPADAPWHEQQLYKLYGKNADYYLHPKIENKVQVKKANPKLRRQGGRAGAEILWETLRQDSNSRLLQEDASIPMGLKDAYGAFARQTIRKAREPVKRMYCVEEDLPEMPRLMDNRKLLKLRKMRHKSDIMYRSSVSNKDRTEVLTFNNPLPDFNSRAESIDQYLPSWQDDSSISTQPEYLQWIQNKGRLARENTIQEEGEEQQEAEPRFQPNQSMDDDLIYILARRKHAAPKQKYIFLSEKDATVKGEFSEKYKEDRDYKDLPRPYKGDMPKSYSAMGGMISATPDMKSSTPSMRHSAPLPSRQDMINNYTSNWQPLSMHALVEYKKRLVTVGDGDFNLGRTKMWSQIPVISS